MTTDKMQYEGLRNALTTAVPMVGHIGIEIIELRTGHAVARLPDDARLRNHVGSQHAAGLFALAETASGAAMASTLMQHLANATPLAKSAEIQYKRLARGPVTATATLDQDVAARIIAALEAEGRAQFSIAVAMADSEGRDVAAMTVQWHVARRAS